MVAALLVILTALLLTGGVTVTQPLFVIERSKNTNVLHYDAQLTPDGKLDPREPVTAYWIMHEENGQREDLTWLEKKKAYGFDIEPEKGGGGFRMILKPVPKRTIRIYQDGTEIRAEAAIGRKTGRLGKLYIKSDETKMLPKVLCIELFGTDTATGELLYEKLVPTD
jgi:hypothetical protein